MFSAKRQFGHISRGQQEKRAWRWADKVGDINSNSNSTSVQDEMTAVAFTQLGQTTLQLLQKNLNIKPPLEIRPGYQFNIIVTKDVIFRGAYAGR